MIADSLEFLVGRVNEYLAIQLGPTTDERVVLGNVSRAFDADAAGTALANKVILSLVNVEEDRVAKQQENFVRSDNGVKYKSPPVYLNLYVLFAANRTLYKDALLYLSYLMQCFQYQNVFTPATHPVLGPKGIQQLVADLYTLNFEASNQLWSTLGGKYIPSVLYKVRQVTIDANVITGESGYITEIDLNDKQLNPAS
jgi:hypothetical protein